MQLFELTASGKPECVEGLEVRKSVRLVKVPWPPCLAEKGSACRPSSSVAEQAKDLRAQSMALAARISMLKGCVPSCFGMTGKELVEAAADLDRLPGMVGIRGQRHSWHFNMWPAAIGN